MTQIFHLQGDRHQQAQTLLPWYVNGTLDPDEVAAVEAHLAECPDCRADLEAERVLGQEVASLSLDVDHGWAALRDRLEPPSAKRGVSPLRGSAAFLRRPVPMGWVITAQAACLALAVIGVVSFALPAIRADSEARYRTLSSAEPAPAGNIVVMFKPNASELALRQALRQAGARVVDGPTTADAYVLHVEPGRRADALSRLRANGDVQLAEPIDGDPRS